MIIERSLERTDVAGFFNNQRTQKYYPLLTRAFCKFSKILIKSFKSLIFPQLRVPEKRAIARLKGLVLGFQFGQVSPCRRAPVSPCPPP